MSETESLGVAIIGLAGRFPQSVDLESFWELLKNGREAIVECSDEELLAAGVESALLGHPDYVKVAALIPEVDYFDADFFNLSARDAAILDPQQRLFIECAWQALEQAGYPPATTAARIGLYVGISENTYQHQYLEPHRATLLSTVGAYRLSTLSNKDFLATRCAYLLNLTGAAMTIQTACSSSLVAVHVACQSLLNFECDMMLAGGVSITFPQKQGYLYQPGMILSKEGRCRAFDAEAQGTVGGGGVGVVLLKRLDEALADGDTIHPVIRGSAVNNDGSDKIGYTAPSVKGQTEVILEAQAAADIHPDDISYIEAHGTGTPLGDPIEIQALTQAFRTSTQRQGYCALGSVKTNIGHADAAAGIAGLIKTVLALKQRQLPPSLHFNKPNPHIDFEQSPFFVNERLRNWEAEERCAGVSAFGIGGTNAHLIVAQAPKVKASGASRPLQLITLSAKTVSALQTATSQLAQWLHHHADLSLADVAYTLNRGRQHFAYRRVLVCAQLEEAYAQLLTPGQSYHALNQAGQVALLFPGQGSQYIGMTQGLYATERVFQHALEQCAQILSTHLEHDLREILYHNPNSQLLNQTVFTQPILFAVEYALAQLWLSWGIQPQALLGHSLGEYVAACLAGVFSLEEALTLVAVRGQLIQSSPAGALLALPLSEQALQPWLTPNLSLAAVNGAERCVLSGDRAAIETVQQQLRAQGIESRRVQAEHGFHSHLLTPILAAFKQQMQKITLNKPKIPFLSNLTGTWIAPEQAVDPDYWVQHLRYPVRFNDNLHSLCQHNIELLLEVGPGQTLSSLARQHSARFSVFSSLPQQKHPESSAEMTHLLSTLGQLWAHGVTVNWEGFYAAERRHRLPLPTYPFERKRYWLDTPQQKQNDKPVQEKKAAQPLAPAKFQAPSTPLEAQLAEIWQLFLGVSSVGVEDDFFELGGDSLLAVQLAAHLRTQWRVQVGPQALLTAPTIARLAQLIEHNTHDSSAALLVELKAGLSQRLPLFMVHPIGGHVFSYRALAKHLAAEQPVYGIQVQHVDAQRSQIEPMATHYIHHLKTRQPKGPYCLGGASFGGVVAYEMAQQLSQQGEPIALLALIDTPEPGNRVDNTLNDEVEIMAYIVNLLKGITISTTELCQMDLQSRWQWFMHATQGDKTTSGAVQSQMFIDIFRAHIQALLAYQPQPWKGKALYFRAMERSSEVFWEQFWRSQVQGGLELYFIPGNHLTMNEEPNVHYLAHYLQSQLTIIHHEGEQNDI